MERFKDTRNMIEGFVTKEELVSESICDIRLSIEDIFIAETYDEKFSDEEIALYAKEISQGVVVGIVEYLKKNHNIDAVLSKKALADASS